MKVANIRGWRISANGIDRTDVWGFLIFLSLAFYIPVHAATFHTSQSHFAILTEKEGVASAIAHRHIITASGVSGGLTFDSRRDAKGIPSSGRAEVTIPVAGLIVDSPEASAGIIEIFESHGVWSVAKDRLEPSNSEKVRANMLDESQLNSKKYPFIESSGRFDDCKMESSISAKCQIELAVTVRGKSVKRSMPILLSKQGGNLSAVFVGQFKFSEFGIQPYKALFGAIAVKDEFTLAAKVSASE